MGRASLHELAFDHQFRLNDRVRLNFSTELIQGEYAFARTALTEI
jgi:hypothetical protein